MAQAKTKEQGQEALAWLGKQLEPLQKGKCTGSYPLKAYAVQLEQGKEGTYHLQGMVMIDTAASNVSRTTFQETILGDEDGITHCEAMIDPAGSWEYCRKESTRVPGTEPITFGSVKSKQGKRTDLEDFYKDAKNVKTGEKTAAEVKDTHFKVRARHFKFFETVLAENTSARTEKTRCIVLFGDSGCGKTFRAKEMCANVKYTEDEVYTPPANVGNNALWWDGYVGQKAVILEEFDSAQFGINMFKQMMGQSSPLMVQSKGISGKFTSKLVIICCNEHPRSWWGLDKKMESADEKTRKKAKTDWMAVSRRIDLCEEVRYSVEPKDAEELEQAWKTAIWKEIKFIY